MGRYICEVKKDNTNNELELVHADKFGTSSSSPGAIKFNSHGDMYEYFNKYCVSEDVLRKESEAGNKLFSFLFFILLSIFICTIVWQMCNKGNNSGTGGTFGMSGDNLTNTAFGRFSF